MICPKRVGQADREHKLPSSKSFYVGHRQEVRPRVRVGLLTAKHPDLNGSSHFRISTKESPSQVCPAAWVLVGSKRCRGDNQDKPSSIPNPASGLRGSGGLVFFSLSNKAFKPFILCVWVFFSNLCLCIPCVSSDHGGQKRVKLLELWMVVRYHMGAGKRTWVL
jgi:hypothetical protein